MVTIYIIFKFICFCHILSMMIMFRLSFFVAIVFIYLFVLPNEYQLLSFLSNAVSNAMPIVL